MQTSKLSTRLMSLALTVAAGTSVMAAQSYYDDDIYFDPSKQKKETTVQKKNKQQPVAAPSQYYYDGAQYVPWDNVGNYASADTYTATGSSTRDVDEYNRRTPSSAPSDSITLEQYEEMAAGGMSNTRNLARFHNSQSAQQAYADNEGTYYDANGNLQDLYNQGYNAGYQAGQSNGSTINLTVGTGWGWPYYSSWSWPYYSSWSWGWPYYSSWSWGWGPSWSWSWGPSWSWGWGPSWSWGWGPSWGGWGPSWGWAPRYYNNPPGATRPNRGNGSYYGGSNRYNYGNRGGSIANSNGRRPSTGTVAGNAGSVSRPGYSAPIGRPSTAGSATGTYQRGRAGYNNNGTTTTPSRGTNNYNPTYNRGNSQPSGNYNRGRSSSSSSGSFGTSRSSGSFGGSHSSGSFGGGSRSGGGGGGHRGR